MSGVPVVISRVLGHVDIVEDGKTGLMFDINSPKEAAVLIDKLLSDPFLWHSLRRNAYDKAQKDFTVERMIHDTENVYRDVFTNSLSPKGVQT